MKRLSAFLASAGMILWAGGCAHAPAESRLEVRFVTDREMVNGCVNLGRVEGSSSLGGISGQQLGKLRAEGEMRDQARRKGADTVLVDSSKGGFWGAKSDGDAYKCEGRARETRGTVVAPPPSIPQSGQSSQGGCEKDTDCKGDRVCEFGKCVNPEPAPR